MASDRPDAALTASGSGRPDGSPHDWAGCSCGQQARLEAQEEQTGRQEAATSNVTDLRRARQKARSVIRDIVDDILAWMGANQVDQMLTDPSGARRTNRALVEIASQRLRDDLLTWLVERNRITAGRAARSANDAMTSIDGITDDDIQGEGGFDRRFDAETLRQIRQVDAGLLYDTELADDLGLNEPLAQELGNDITRSLRQGIANDEDIRGGLTDRVEAIITDGDHPDRQELGITGQTKKTKAELIAHDSVQDAYNQAARGRYLRNGFRYAVFDATIDFKTSQVCERMNEVVVDMVDDPFLLPPLHPWCRSGLRPILDLGDREPITRDDVADSFLQTIMATKSYRPPADAAGRFRPTSLTRQQGQA